MRMGLRVRSFLSAKQVVFCCLVLFPGAAPAAFGKDVVLTSFQPLYSFTAKILQGSPNLEVFNLAPRQLGPHDFSVEDPAYAERNTRMARRAVAVVTLRSLGLASNFDRLYPWCRTQNIRIVEIDPAVTWDPSVPKLPLIDDPSDTRHGKERPAGEPVLNPHVWLGLNHAVRLVDRIRQDITALDPANSELYSRNTLAFQRELLALRMEYERNFAGIDNPVVATLTEGFPYLTADFAINVADYILEPRDAQEVRDRIRAAGVKVVLAEEQPTEDMARAVKQAGARVVVLSTLEEGWGHGQELEPDGYLKGMRDNLSRLYAAFKAH